MLYDRLIVPVPADHDEWERWEGPDLSWNPSRQSRVLNAIKRLEQEHDQKLVLQIPWDEDRRRAFADHEGASRWS